MLPMSARATLRAEQKIVDTGTSARDEWDRYRGLVAAQTVVDALRRMAGVGERCAYCSDSLGADIDHFAPIADRPEDTFAWGNLYWICNNCNRRKSQRFRVDPMTGEALVLRPDVDRPWDFLYLDTETGVIAPRLRGPQLLEDERARETLAVLKVLSMEAVVDARRRAFRNLSSRAHSYLTSQSRLHSRELVEAFREETRGVKAWVSRYEGQVEAPWRDLAADHPRTWRRLRSLS